MKCVVVGNKAILKEYGKIYKFSLKNQCVVKQKLAFCLENSIVSKICAVSKRQILQMIKTNTAKTTQNSELKPKIYASHFACGLGF
ncbi:hypothetical protein [Campylobacter geochelonis]|uniref:hypothetical protein n=1 Tax=Campylobacter geochelonis TaxID=1780362 RepID=UPI0007707F62|nr:hypothetical protein [Campylobacter geochelonis]CZE46321.1 Uncharacterised protein [Campylobacter geochelonis]